MQSCCKFFLSKALFTRSRFCLKTDMFFLRLSLPSTLTNALKLITGNAPFQKRSPESRFLKTYYTRLFFYVWTDENGFEFGIR